MTSCVLSSYFKLFTSIMHPVTLIPPRCLSHAKHLHIMREFFDLLSEFMYVGEGEVVWRMFLHDFLGMLDEC